MDNKSFYNFILIVGVAIMFAAPLLSQFWAPPSADKELIAYDKFLKQKKFIKANRIDSISAFASTDNKELQQYINVRDSIDKEYATTRKINWATREKIRLKDKFGKFLNVRKFMIGFGTRITILLLATLLLISLFVKDQYLKKLIKIAAIVMVGLGIYLNLWYLLPITYSKGGYLIAIVALSVTGGVLMQLYLENRHKKYLASKQAISDKLDNLSEEFKQVIKEVKDIEIISKAIQPDDHVLVWKQVTKEKAEAISELNENLLKSIDNIQKN